MKNIFLFIGFVLSTGLTLSQSFANRYEEEIFTMYDETSEILFCTGVPQPKPGGGFYEWITGLPLNVDEWDTSSENLYMDIFEPTADTLSKRPLIIICFGGAFLSGSKDHWSIRLLAQKLAKRGYVTATIDYRIGMNIFDSDLAMRAVYRGLQDGRSAVRFFKSDAAGSNTYRIDTTNIFIGGHSSGAFIGLHNLYLDKEVERPASTYIWIQDGHLVADMGCLDCGGNNSTFTGNATACFSLAGALGFTSYIENASDHTSVMFHSTDDGTVPYYSGQPFESLLTLVIGADLPDVYGSDSIATRCGVVGLSYDFSSYTNRGHDVHENGGSTLYSDIIPNINNWFFNNFLKPKPTVLSGNIHICENELTHEYHVKKMDAQYWDWNVVGGTLVNPSAFDTIVTVDWDLNASTKSISVTPYSPLEARGDTLSLNITAYPPSINTFLPNTSSEWNENSVWSTGNIPLPCDTVIIPNQSNPIVINVTNLSPIIIKSLEVGLNVTLILNTSTNVVIMD